MHHFENNKNNIENTVAKTKIYHLSNYFSLTRLCFFLNKCPYRILPNTTTEILYLQKL